MSDAARGSYELSVEAHIYYDPSDGYDEDLSDNALTMSTTLRVR